ncbi:MAG: hypothetical protein ABIR33_17145 [Pyrinomonadaceae bacterium]
MHSRPRALSLPLAALLGALLCALPADAAGTKHSSAKRTQSAPRVRATHDDAAETKSATEAEGQTAREIGASRKPNLLKVKASRHIEVHARDMRLDDTARERLERIAARYFKATRRKLVLTGGTRTPGRQAELMFEKLAHGEDIVALYENKAAATEVRDVYQDALDKGLKKKALIKAIRERIESLISRGSYVSKHLKSGAADVRSRDMKPRQAEALRAAVKEEAGVTLLDERSGAEPHFHLSLQ